MQSKSRRSVLKESTVHPHTVIYTSRRSALKESTVHPHTVIYTSLSALTLIKRLPLYNPNGLTSAKNSFIRMCLFPAEAWETCGCDFQGSTAFQI